MGNIQFQVSNCQFQFLCSCIVRMMWANLFDQRSIAKQEMSSKRLGRRYYWECVVLLCTIGCLLQLNIHNDIVINFLLIYCISNLDLIPFYHPSHLTQLQLPNLEGLIFPKEICLYSATLKCVHDKRRHKYCLHIQWIQQHVTSMFNLLEMCIFCCV